MLIKSQNKSIKSLLLVDVIKDIKINNSSSDHKRIVR